MIIVRIPTDHLFNYTEVKEMYESNRDVFDDDFDSVIDRSYFYAFYDIPTGELIGCINFFQEFNKFIMNGFAGRKHHKKNIECLNAALTFFTDDIYSQPQNKQAKLCLLRVGFEPCEGDIYHEDNLYVYRRNK